MIIAVTGGKGGTGKSTVATGLAVEYARKKKTMLVDADVECPNDHILLSVKRKWFKNINQIIPKWDLSKCTKCGKCAGVCKQEAVVFVKDKYPAFVKDVCIGCKACIVACPEKAISESKKVIGKVYTGKNYNVDLVSGELKLGELASGEVVSELRRTADELKDTLRTEHVIVDSSAGIGCPVIASLINTDYIVAVTEPTPSALHDLKRVLYLAEHFKIRHGIVINKFDLEKKFCSKIEEFASRKRIPVISRFPYHDDFVRSNILMKPVVEVNSKYKDFFKELIINIEK
ncbi:MAG: ATP-binding protein [Nanoarchaeota archaeon]|nr:ATP-binding protein [Nanoarchaeota archaeon]